MNAEDAHKHLKKTLDEFLVETLEIKKIVSEKYLAGEKSDFSYSSYSHFDGDDCKPHDLVKSFKRY